MACILGGGLSGLSAAYYLLQRGVPITICEASSRLGGWVRTERPYNRDFLFEAGPRTIRPKGAAGANTLDMLEKLNLTLEGVPAHHEASKNRMIYAKGKLCMLPNSLSGIFRKQMPFSKPLLSAFLHDLRSGKKLANFGDESIYDFVQRRFGTELANYAISPMICGICAGDAKEISVRFLMDSLFEKEQKWGGVLKGVLFEGMFGAKQQKLKEQGIIAQSNWYSKAQKEKWSMYRVKQGLETFPRTLGAYLKDHGVDIQLNNECKQIRFRRHEGVILHIKGQSRFVPHVISSMPAFKLAACVRDQHPSLAAQLLSIPYVDVAVVNLVYSSRDILKQKAFGFLVPPIEQIPILGVIFDSCCFDMGENTVLTVMMGGKWFEEYYGRNPSQKELLDIALTQLDKIMGIRQEPRLSRVHILHKCIPQYTVGHKQRVQGIRNYIKKYELPLTVCGAAYDGVGVNDVILSARRQTENLSEI